MNKVYTLPDQDTIIKALTAVNDESYTVEKIYPYIAEKMQTRELTESGIAVGLELNCMDICKHLELPAMLVAVLFMDKEAMIQSIVDVSIVSGIFIKGE